MTQDRTCFSPAVGDFFGEMALLDPRLRSATVLAASTMAVAVVRQREFNDVLDEVPALSHKVMRGLARRHREVDQRETV